MMAELKRREGGDQEDNQDIQADYLVMREREVWAVIQFHDL